MSALLQFLWWTLGGDTWLIRAMCLLWAHLSVKFGGTIPLSWTERQRTKGAGLQCWGKRHKPVQSETNTSHILTFFNQKGFYYLVVRFEREAKNSARVLKALFAFWSRLKLSSEFSGCEKRTDGLTQSQRNVSNLGSGESASVEMFRLCALDRPAPPKRPGPERLWWVSILPIRQTFASFPCLALVTLRLRSAM